MDLKQSISVNRPRESSGSRSANRFDYQKDWAILKLVELYRSGKDYLLVMDYYDDVIIFDSENNPNNIDFFQIKTHSKNWTIPQILSRKKGKDGPLPSIIGKMYGCKLQFPNYTLSLNFESNHFLNVDLKDKNTKSLTKKEIKFSEICDKKLAVIIKQLKEEHSLPDDPEFIEMTFFRVSDLMINDREAYVKGKLSDFLEEINPEGTFKMSLVYTTLFDEVKRKNNYEGHIDNFKDLSVTKGIGRSQFDSIIKNFTEDVNKIDQMWSMTEARLNSERIPIGELFQIKNAWDKYKIEKMDLTNAYLQDIRKKINKIVESYKANNQLYNDIVQPTYEEYVKDNAVDIYDEYYLKSIILMELYGI